MMRFNKSCTKAHESAWEDQVYENMYKEGDYLLDHRDDSITCNPAAHRLHDLKDPTKCQLLRLGPVPQETHYRIIRNLTVKVLLSVGKSQAEAEAEAEANEMMARLQASKIETPKQEHHQVSRPNTDPTGHTRTLRLPRRRPLFCPIITITRAPVTEPERVKEQATIDRSPAADEAAGGDISREQAYFPSLEEKSSCDAYDAWLSPSGTKAVAEADGKSTSLIGEKTATEKEIETRFLMQKNAMPEKDDVSRNSKKSRTRG